MKAQVSASIDHHCVGWNPKRPDDHNEYQITAREAQTDKGPRAEGSDKDRQKRCRKCSQQAVEERLRELRPHRLYLVALACRCRAKEFGVMFECHLLRPEPKNIADERIGRRD